MSNIILLFDKIFMKTFLFLEDLFVNGFGHAQTESWRAHDHTSSLKLDKGLSLDLLLQGFLIIAIFTMYNI